MKYTYSEHYREDPFAEIETALSANSLSSVQNTLENRLDNENRRSPLDTEAIERIQSQLEYLGSLATAQELEAA